MPLPFSLFLALKYLKPKRSVTSVVTFVSILGVLLGVAIVIIVRAVMTGFGDMWKEKILDFKPHITLTSAGPARAIENEQMLCAQLEQIPGVVVAVPGLEMRVLVEHSGRIIAPLILGTDPSRAQQMMSQTDMTDGSLELEGDSVVIGKDLARQLGLTVGDDLLVYSPMNLVSKDEVYFPERLTVTGIYNSGRYDFDSGYVIASVDVVRDLMGMKRGVYSIHLKVTDPQNSKRFNAVKNEVQNLFPISDYTMRTWEEIDHTILDAVRTEKNMMAILLMFITIVAIFCVIDRKSTRLNSSH